MKISYDVEEGEQVGDGSVASRYEDADDVVRLGCKLGRAAHGARVRLFQPVLKTVRVEAMVAFRLEKSILRNLLKADGALTVRRVPWAVGRVGALDTLQREGLAASHFGPKTGISTWVQIRHGFLPESCSWRDQQSRHSRKCADQ